MCFISPTQLLITNEIGNCVEEFNFDSHTIVPYIGECSSNHPEMIEGHRLNDVKIKRAVGINYDGRGTLFTGLGSSQCIIATEVANGWTSLFNHVPNAPRYLHFDVQSQKLFATLSNGFVTVSNDNMEYIVAKSTADRGTAIGSLAESQVNSPNDFIKLINGVWLLSDRKNHR